MNGLFFPQYAWGKSRWSSGENKGFNYLLNVIDVFSKYAWSIPIKDKTGKSITDAFQKIVKTSGRRPKKVRG